MRVVCCGSRHWTDEEKIRQELKKLPNNTFIAHGNCGYDAEGNALWDEPDWKAVRGADKLCGKVAWELGLLVLAYTPHWKLLGKRAGPARNTQMLNDFQPDLVIAFFTKAHSDPGTHDTVLKAVDRGIRVIEVHEELDRGFEA